MKPAPFNYQCAADQSQALEALYQYGSDARVLAGGQSLMPMLAMRLAQPAWLIDISRTPDLDYVRCSDTHLCIGAAATQAAVHARADLAREVPLLAQALPWISHMQIRSRGTVCGSLAHADPSAELALTLVALGGEVVLTSKAGQRVLQANDFFQGMLQTALADGELLTEARFPLHRPGQRYAFAEFAQRRGDFAIAAVAMVIETTRITLAVGGVEDRPRALQWPLMPEQQLRDAITEFSESLEARDDPHASAQYRRHLAGELAYRALRDLSVES